MKEKELSKLVKQAIDGNVDAFAKLYATFSRSVYYIGLRITKNDYDANDVVQETMLKLYSNLKNIKNKDSIYYFIRTTAYNCSIDILRANKGVFTTEDEVIEGLSDNIEDDFVPEKYLENAEKRQQVVSLVNDLNDPQRTVVLMYYFDDLSVKEIADILEVKEAVVTSRLYRARGSLKTQLKKMNVKGVLSLAMATTVLSNILALDAKASLTNPVNISNWQSICASLGNTSASAQAALPIINAAVAAPASVGIALAAQGTTAATIGGIAITSKGVAIALSAAIAVGSISYGTYYIIDNNGSKNESSIINKDADATSQELTSDGTNILVTPHQDVTNTQNSEDTVGLGEVLDSPEALAAVSPGKNAVQVEKLMIYYKKGSIVSEEQFITDIGVTSTDEAKITTKYFDQVDFNAPNEYLVYVYDENAPSEELGQIAIIVIVEELSTGG